MINPFIQGTQLVFTSLCGEAPSLGKVFIKTQPYTPLDISVAVTLLGAITGDVVFNLRAGDCSFIASKMMRGASVGISDMSLSAISELANMISGNAATLFSGRGLLVDISTPRCTIDGTAKDYPSAREIEKIVCVPLIFSDNHKIELDILIL